jgi:hypothetical protein
MIVVSDTTPLNDLILVEAIHIHSRYASGMTNVQKGTERLSCSPPRLLRSIRPKRARMTALLALWEAPRRHQPRCPACRHADAARRAMES